MLVASFHRRPNISVDSTKGEVDEFVVAQHSCFGRWSARRSVTIVYESTDWRSLRPRLFVKAAVNLQWRGDARYFVRRNLLSTGRCTREATQNHCCRKWPLPCLP